MFKKILFIVIVIDILLAYIILLNASGCITITIAHNYVKHLAHVKLSFNFN